MPESENAVGGLGIGMVAGIFFPSVAFIMLGAVGVPSSVLTACAGPIGIAIFIGATVLGCYIGDRIDITEDERERRNRSVDSSTETRVVQAEFTQKVKKVYDKIKEVMDPQSNNEDKKTKIKKILFQSFASPDISQRIVINRQQLDVLMSLTVNSEFNNKEILQLMQGYCKAVLETDDGSKLVDTFVENFGQQTGAGRGEQRSSAPSASVFEAGAGVSNGNYSLLC